MHPVISSTGTAGSHRLLTDEELNNKALDETTSMVLHGNPCDHEIGGCRHEDEEGVPENRPAASSWEGDEYLVFQVADLQSELVPIPIYPHGEEWDRELNGPTPWELLRPPTIPMDDGSTTWTENDDTESFLDDSHDGFLYMAENGGFFAELEAWDGGWTPAAKAVVEGLPAVVVREEDVANGDNLCAICWDEIECGDRARQLPCSHRYHGRCTVAWLGIRNTCPVCRHELPVEGPAEQEWALHALGTVGAERLLGL